MKLDQQDVHEALDNALDNGYTSFLKGDPLTIAFDMIEYDVQFEDRAPFELVPHIETWQTKQGEAA